MTRKPMLQVFRFRQQQDRGSGSLFWSYHYHYFDIERPGIQFPPREKNQKGKLNESWGHDLVWKRSCKMSAPGCPKLKFNYHNCAHQIWKGWMGERAQEEGSFIFCALGKKDTWEAYKSPDSYLPISHTSVGLVVYSADTLCCINTVHCRRA